MDAVAERDELSHEGYVPNAVERKKAVLMYVGIGMVLGVTEERRTAYEVFHLKQAVGIWSSIVFALVAGLPLLVVASAMQIGWLIALPLVLVCAILVCGVLCARWAWNGSYSFVKIPIFTLGYSVGNRLLSLFNIS